MMVPIIITISTRRRRYNHHALLCWLLWLTIPLPADSLSLKRGGGPSPSASRVDRRSWLKDSLITASAVVLAGATAMAPHPTFLPTVAHAETVGKDPQCTSGNCLGVWDGLLADCPHGVSGGGGSCVSSQDDTPGIFAEPWDYADVDDTLSVEELIQRILAAIALVGDRRGDSTRVLINEGRYLRVAIADRSGSVSTGEFYLTPNDTTVQFRIAATTTTAGVPSTLSLRNLERAELYRRQLRYPKLVVLRNRRRSLFFGESEFDTFGPGSAALGPPAEMRTGELDGRQDVDPRKKLDAVQKFPMVVGR